MRRGIFEAHLAHKVGEFYAAHFANPDARAEAVSSALRPLDPDVYEALRIQNEALGESPTRQAHLDALRTGAAAVVTGQQVGLLLGPLYTVYKALTAVVAAKRLAEETGQPVVPIFWIQSEDHDLPEVASITCPAVKSGDRIPSDFSLPADPESRVSLEHQVLPTGIDPILAQLADTLASLPYAKPHLERVRRHYRPGLSYVAAFTGLLAELTGKYGLLFVNPRDPRLARVARSLHEEALVKADIISERLLERGRELENAGYTEAVHVRPGAPLAFFHPDGPCGPRYRLLPVPGGYTLLGGPKGLWSTQSLIDRLTSDPLCFSTSALLRPLLQDRLLPTAAYVGGPAEVAYLAQLQPIYPLFGRQPPLVLPRARAFVIEPSTRRALEHLKLPVRDAADPEAVFRASPDTAGTGTRASDVIEARVLQPLLRSLEIERTALEPAGPDLERAWDRTRQSVTHNIQRLIEKTRRAEQAKDQVQMERFERVRASLYPKGTPQERVYGLSYFAARYGEDLFLDLVKDAIRPFDAQILELYP